MPTLISILLLLAFCCGCASREIRMGRFRTNDEVIPKQVRETARRQIQRYFPTLEFAGVPLLDPEVDWNDFKNWPDEFEFRGESYSLRLVDFSGGDYIVDLKSRSDIRPSIAFLAVYYKKGTQAQGALKPSGYWIRGGSIQGKILELENDCVFGYKYYPTGRLFCFTRNNFETHDYRLEYFDRNGRLVAVCSHAGGKGPGLYYWKGHKTDEDAFLKAQERLFKSNSR